MSYSLDSSVFINGWNKHFHPDSFPGVWENLSAMYAKGRMHVTEEVRFEIEKRDDDLWKWIRNRQIKFVPHGVEIQKAVREILRQYPRLIDERKNRSGADPFVIALAKVRGLVVVTDEMQTGNDKRPKIPAVCSGLGIKCINLHRLIREEGWVFQ